MTDVAGEDIIELWDKLMIGSWTGDMLKDHSRMKQDMQARGLWEKFTGLDNQFLTALRLLASISCHEPERLEHINDTKKRQIVELAKCVVTGRSK